MLLCHTLPQASMPTPPSQAFYKNRTTNSKTFCPIIWLRSSSSSLIERQLEVKKAKTRVTGQRRGCWSCPEEVGTQKGIAPRRWTQGTRRAAVHQTSSSDARAISPRHSAKVTARETWNVASAPRNLLKSPLGFGTVLLVSTLITVKQTEGTSGQR